MWWPARRAVTCRCRRWSSPSTRGRHSRCCTDGASFNRDVRDAVNVIGGCSRLQKIAERALHFKQLVNRRYIFPAGEEDLEQDWLDSNVARLKQIMDDIPVELGAANFSDGQKMVMLERQHPDSIHMAIKDAVDQKGAGLYDFMIGLTCQQTDL